MKTFRVSGVHGQTGVLAQPCVVKWGSSCAPEAAKLAQFLAVGLRWKEKHAMDQSARKLVSWMWFTLTVVLHSLFTESGPDLAHQIWETQYSQIVSICLILPLRLLPAVCNGEGEC